MKKLLSLVLVLAVVLSTMSFAFAAAPSDLGDYKYADAVKKLVGLGIINGYPDGTFKPAGNITRAEFAKVVVTALGYGDAAVAAGDAKFTDMVGHWAVGYVNVASSLGIINGVGGGKFAPDANVKYEEAVTMIVRALGYEPAAKSNGGYPNGYLTIASQKKITKDVALVAGNIADRGTVAKLMAESLEVPFLEQTGYGTLTEYKEAKHLNAAGTDYITDKSLMLTGLKLVKAEGIVVDSYDATAKTVKFTTDVDKKRTYSFVEPINVLGTKNCKIDFWYKDGVIYAFENKTTVKFDQIKKVNDSDKKTDSTGTIASFTLKNDGGLYYTNAADIKKNDASFSAATLTGYIDEYAKFYIYDNKIFKVEMFTLGNPGLVAEASAAKIKYQTYDTNDAYLSNIDTATDLLYVFVDGSEKTIADIKPGMVFQSWASGKKIVIAAASKTVSGKLASYQDEKVTIASTTYDTRNKNYSDDKQFVSLNNGTKYDKYNVNDLVGLDVVANFDLVGKVAFVKGTATSVTNDFYGLVKSWKSEGKTITVVRDVNGVSTEVEYAVKTDTDELKGSTSTSKTFTPSGSTDIYLTWYGFSFLTSQMYDGNPATNGLRTVGDMNQFATEADAQDRIYKFWVNSDNKITKIMTVEDAANETNFKTAIPDFTGKFNKDTGAIADSSIYGDSAVIFDLKDSKVRYWNDIKDKDANPVDGALSIATDNTYTSKAVVIAFLNNKYSSIVSTDRFYAFVTGESYDGTWYTITTSAGETLKLHKDDLGSTNANKLDNKFLTYIKESDRIKVKAVDAAVYASGTEFMLESAGTGAAFAKVFDAGDATGTLSENTTIYVDTFFKNDGNFIVLNNGAGADIALKKSADMKVIRLTWNSALDGIDTTSVSDVTSITGNSNTALADKVLVITDTDNTVRAIYYVH